MSSFKKRRLNTEGTRERFTAVHNKKQANGQLAKTLETRDSRPRLDGSSPEVEQSSFESPVVAESGAKKTFSDLGIMDQLCEACTKLGFKHPTPIQTEAIPLALQGRDLIGLAETGSGKTAAFALPMLQALWEKPQAFYGLILAPTRELAYQISEQVEALGSEISVRCTVLVGGMDMVPQSIALGKKPHVVVATPGRLIDHLENTRGFSLRTLKYLVVDEADRLLDLDFGPILDKILRVLPRERRTYLFSATMSSKVESLQRASLSSPLRVSISSSSHQTVSTLLQSYIFIPHKHKDIYLTYLLSTSFAGQTVIVFARTVNEVQRLAFLLRALGFGAIPLHGQLSQSARLGALSRFRARSRDILVATDVAARGLDIPSVDAVINFDLPPDSKTYVHRVGRTARAGKSGHAVSVVTQYDIEIWMRIEKALGRKLEEKSGVEKEEALVLSERVGEAQRVAIKELKDEQERRGSRGGRTRGRNGARRTRDEMDREEG